MSIKGPYVVGFNGPPRSGKDTIATQLANKLDRLTDMPIQRFALAAPMRESAFAILGLTGGDKFYNDIKDKPLEILQGGSLRKFMIDMSEVFVKNLYGKDFWSRRLYATNQFWWHKYPAILIVTDIGFDAEVKFLCEHSESYLNVRLDRPGPFDFSGDSRGYCSAQNCGGTDFALTNDETPDDAADKILGIIGKLGWPVL